MPKPSIFGSIEDHGVAVEATRHAVVELAQVVFTVGVVERQHRDRALDLRELRHRRVADPLGRRPRDHPVGMLAFGRAQLTISLSYSTSLIVGAAST